MSTNSRSIRGFILVVILIMGLFLISAFFQTKVESQNHSLPMTMDELFDFDGIKEVYFQFTDSAWFDMQPVGGPFGLPEGVFWLNLGRLWAPIYLNAGDENRDGMFSYEEFIGLADKWYSEWDTRGNDSLDMDLLEDGYLKSTNGGLTLQGPDRNGVARALGVSTPTVTADLHFGELEVPSITVRYKGNGTLMDAGDNLKRSIKVDLNDGFKGRKIAGISKFNFQNLITDASYMHDALGYRIFRDAGVPSPRTSFAEVYMTVPDSLEKEYIGLYLILENVDNNFARSWYGTVKGVIFKPVTTQLFDYLGDNWDDYIKSYEPKTPLSPQESNRIIELCKLVSLGSDEEFASRIGEYIDMDNFARYMAINVFLTDLDGIMGPGQNMYLYLHPKTFKLSFIAWDHDHSFGQMRGTQEEREQLSIDHPWMFQNNFLERMFNLPNFKDLYLKYMREFNETLFQPERILAQMDSLARVIRPSIEKETEVKLKNFDFSVGWNDLASDPLDSAYSVDPRPLRAFIYGRHQSVADQLSGRSDGLEIKSGYLPRGIFGSGLLSTLDLNLDSIVSRQEMTHAYDSMFSIWNTSSMDDLTYEELVEGMNNNWNGFGPDPRKLTVQESTN